MNTPVAQQVADILTAMKNHPIDVTTPALLHEWMVTLLSLSMNIGAQAADAERDYYKKFVLCLGEANGVVSKAEIYAKATDVYHNKKQLAYLYVTTLEGIKLLKKFLRYQADEELASHAS